MAVKSLSIRIDEEMLDVKKKKSHFSSSSRFFHTLLIPLAAAAAKSLQSCPTLWEPIDGSPPGSPVPGIL